MDGKKSYLYPFKVYSCRSIKKSLQEKLDRPGFTALLFKGLQLQGSSAGMSDICDGDIYKTFVDNEGKPFFQNRRNLGVLMNLDWFNPFEKTKYSIGVIYLVIINLPRQYRFKWENVIVLGVIPGPKEPELTINSFLKPHVDELLDFWAGVVMQENGSPALYTIALLGSSSDVPASRKCGGFMAHNANKGI